MPEKGSRTLTAQKGPTLRRKCALYTHTHTRKGRRYIAVATLGLLVRVRTLRGVNQEGADMAPGLSRSCWLAITLAQAHVFYAGRLPRKVCTL